MDKNPIPNLSENGMNKLPKIVVATRNTAKINYYKPILASIVDTVVGLDELKVTEKPTETGETSEENAKIKAIFYAHKTGLPVFSEDEALYVDFLPQSQQPGTHVRRINGRDEVDDNKLLAHWDNIISRVPKAKRTGYWHISYCIAKPDGTHKTASANHKVMFFSPSSPTKIPGWPLSSIQGSIYLKKPHSEFTKREKQLDQKKDKVKLIKLLPELI